MPLPYQMYSRILKSIIKSTFSSSPIIYIWEITYRCNMRCCFCNIWRLNPQCYMDEMSMEEGIALLRQAAHLGASLFYLTGGEPLLRKDIGEILMCAKQMHMITMMGTNGFFIEDKIEEIKAHLDYLRVAIDSLKHHDDIRQCPSALEHAINGIKLAKKFGIKVIINATITSETINEMEDLIKLANELNCEITLSPLAIIPKGERLDLSFLLPEYKKYAASVRELKKKYACVINSNLYLDLVERGGLGFSTFKCKAPYIVLTVSPQGDICFPCNAYPIKKINIKKIGNLRKAWYSESANQIREEIKKYNFCNHCINRCYLLPSILFSMKGIYNILSNPAQKRQIF